MRRTEAAPTPIAAERPATREEIVREEITSARWIGRGSRRVMVLTSGAPDLDAQVDALRVLMSAPRRTDR